MSRGRICFVGAGPGDPGLLTARALELIAAADVILYDRLIPDEALAGARADAELRYVGKEGGGASVPQEEIMELLLARAAAGSLVVRLKGGDPFVFGRGGEEAQVVRAAGIRFEVVPGVTAAVAAAAYAGIPLTHRDHASAVALVTAHEDPDKAQSALDWAALAAFPGTLVFYMGVRRLEAIAARLIGAGRRGEEPAAVIERGTLPGQRVVHGRLETIAAADVVPERFVAESLAASLEGFMIRRALIARAAQARDVLPDALRARGVEVTVLALYDTVAEPLAEEELAGARAADYITFTSSSTVRFFLAVGELGPSTRIASIGPVTSATLREHGYEPHVEAARHDIDGLVDALVADAAGHCD
ncbi:MAG: uroporphyrinogen-III C-methyltransferase [Actinobacteria bacterium]|nr:uroporphyrinogen-III C-methyltransferase [Actinomycetota bacterium]